MHIDQSHECTFVNLTNAETQAFLLLLIGRSTSQMHIGQPHAGIECNIHSSLLSGFDLDPVGAELGVI